MSKKSFLGNIKVIVLVGYLFLFALAVFGIVKVNQELIHFTQKENPQTESKKLQLVSNTLLSLYEMESLRKILFTKELPTTSLQETYDTIRGKLNQEIDSLYHLSNDQQLQVNLDTVKMLLTQKENNLNDMLALMDSINNLPYSNILSKTVLSTKSVDALSRMITESTKKNQDTTLYVEKKRSFFERVKNVFSDQPDSIKVVSKSDTTHVDTSYIEPPATVTDTIVQYINQINAKSDRRKINYLTKLSKRQTDMLYYDELLTHQINTILRRIEQNEKQQAQYITQQKQELLQKSSSTVYWIALIALLVLVLFIALSLAQINRSQRYKNDLEKSNQYAGFLAKSREKLLLMISHDIKAPLSSIIGHTELLTDKKAPQQQQKSIGNIRSSAEQILDLSNKLLEYHKLEQGKSEVKNITFAPHRLISDIYESYLPLAKSKNITLHQDNQILPNTLYQSDPYIIRQILDNLISNAIKFTPKGTVHIASSIDSSQQLHIAIKDTGMGISEEDQKKLFDQFQRLGTLDEKRAIEGHGLGLSITLQLTHLIGGQIDVLSQLHKGTTFTLSIPLASSTDEQKPLLTTHTTPTISHSIVGKKVLFIDDDATMLNVYASIIEKKGAIVTTCFDPTRAIEHIQKNRFDIIFTDIQMPQLNGIELVKRIRKLGGYYATIPIVALSARSTMALSQLQEIGCTDFATKPINPDQLIHHIAQTQQNPPTTPHSNAPKGLDALVEFVKEDREMSAEIIQTFWKDNQKKLQQLQKAAKKNDAQTLQDIAHKLLPLMKMIQADEMVSLLIEIEEGSYQEEQVQELIALLKQQNQATKRYITDHFS